MENNLPLRFKNKIIKNGSCLEWTGYVNPRGYGQVSYKGKNHKIHRVVWQILRGPLDDKHIDHLCRNRRCVNVDHMEPVTKKENTLRGISFSAINAKKETCKNGHAFNRTYKYKGSKKSFNQRICDICRRTYRARYIDKFKSAKRGEDNGK